MSLNGEGSCATEPYWDEWEEHVYDGEDDPSLKPRQ